MAFGGPCMTDMLVVSAKLLFNLTTGTASTVPISESLFLLSNISSRGYEMKHVRCLDEC